LRCASDGFGCNTLTHLARGVICRSRKINRQRCSSMLQSIARLAMVAQHGYGPIPEFKVTQWSRWHPTCLRAAGAIIGTARQWLQLFRVMHGIQLIPETHDSFICRWSSTGCYSAHTVYEALFLGQSVIWGQMNYGKCAPPTSVNFSFGCSCMNVCGHLHDLNNHGPCALCSQEVEIINHLFVGCSYSREVWVKSLR
jgi:hypothetical protein